MNKKMSNKITNINFYMTIIIVLLHSNCMSYANTTQSLYSVCFIIQKIIYAFCCIAVPTFFVISSYLFFRNYELLNYKNKLKTRFYSLVIPYLLWSSIFLVYTILITNIKFISSIDSTLMPVQYNFISFIKYILFATYDGPLWYVLVLIFFIVISPFIYSLIKKIKKFNWLLIFLIFFLNIIYMPSYNGILYWLPLYYIAAYLTVNYKQVMEKEYIRINKFRYIIIINFIILTLLTIIFNSNYRINYIYEMFVPVMVFIYFYSSKFLIMDPSKMAKSSFFIYCIHFPIVIALKRIFVMIGGNNPVSMIFMQFIVCIVAILIILFVISILKKFLPGFLKIISGNRI